MDKQRRTERHPDDADKSPRPDLPRVAARRVIVMGVSGCGKTLVGQALADGLGWDFIEGDRLHSPENVARMTAGIPLTDALREGWLNAIGARIAEARQHGAAAVVACSALKRRYRDRLRQFEPSLVLVHLRVSPATARDRVGRRQGHFMPASLVDSQFADLMPPDPDENALELDGERPADALVREAVGFLRSR